VAVARAPVLMNKPGRVDTGEQIHFPHLAKNERDMGHPELWLGESFNGCSFHICLANCPAVFFQPQQLFSHFDVAMPGIFFEGVSFLRKHQ
jgi:hypothetical protein